MNAPHAAAGIDRIADALRFIPANDRETWVLICMAVKDALGDDGYGLWDGWSQTGQSYNERDAQAVWRSIKPGPVQILEPCFILRESTVTGQTNRRRRDLSTTRRRHHQSAAVQVSTRLKSGCELIAVTVPWRVTNTLFPKEFHTLAVQAEPWCPGA